MSQENTFLANPTSHLALQKIFLDIWDHHFARQRGKFFGEVWRGLLGLGVGLIVVSPLPSCFYSDAFFDMEIVVFFTMVDPIGRRCSLSFRHRTNTIKENENARTIRKIILGGILLDACALCWVIGELSCVLSLTKSVKIPTMASLDALPKHIPPLNPPTTLPLNRRVEAFSHRDSLDHL